MRRVPYSQWGGHNMQINLTKEALAKLIELDPKFDVEIRQAVVEGFARKYFIKGFQNSSALNGIRKELDQMAADAVRQAIGNSAGLSGPHGTTLQKAAKKALEDALEETVAEALERWSRFVTSEIETRVKAEIAKQTPELVLAALSHHLSNVVAAMTATASKT